MRRASPNPLPEGSMINAPAKGQSYSPWHRVGTAMLKEFDGSFGEKKLLDPTFSGADNKRQ
jgi:hypothetical protein